MTVPTSWSPTHDDPLLILAMDHRGSFGSSLFGVEHDSPTDEQAGRMRHAKQLIYAGLRDVRAQVTIGRPGVLVDEQYGAAVVAAAPSDDVVLAIPVEASGHDWFTLEYGEQWLDHVREVAPAYAKVLVRDNPWFDASDRSRQLDDLAKVSAGLADAGVPFLYELLVPATDEQKASVSGDTDRYDRDVRPGLVTQVIADNQRAGVAPRLWKVEGLETVDAARAVAGQARSGGHDADLIVLGRDAPQERLDHWLDVAAQVDAFVGFAIGRSIWEEAIRDWTHGTIDDTEAATRIGRTYLSYAQRWSRDVTSS
ncbi:2-deoxy-5-keto-D-gluconate 6-phosphate aldolase domain-containing protein [Allobranchiibius sp. CTAmp26]|uniref:2-deoxy-5-keto-D-gluconate 6-phosphate aldolase domain-containing protein n=1 Tax=Allobranchiibius sp. CTAmp26 TaxID=2815214 RepID=UPI001AA14361|nr:DUF2090 domain-containing protein [Allobranchiibius sp. CTAmp26]MBO1754400.1 DUF2090 domain-containing protein [Allobranchiibius sp. CTAmp26]